MKKLAVLSLLLVVLTGCCAHKKAQDGQAGKAGASGAGFEILKQNAYGGFETESQVKADNQETLASLYKELGIETVPEIDFSTKSVIFAFMGQKPTGGHSITVKDVKADGDTTTVTIVKTTPKPGDNVTMALTAPYCIVAIPKTKEVVYKSEFSK